MNFFKVVFILHILMTICIGEIKPLALRPFIDDPEDYVYSRGTYLIILAKSNLEERLKSPYSDFIAFKRSQGFDVEVVHYTDIADDKNDLRDYLETYSDTNPLLEYVLLIGDVNGSNAIPPHQIPSYNEEEIDVTDYPYTFFNDSDMLKPRFFIGRWSIGGTSDLVNIKEKTVQYTRMENVDDISYLNNAMVVAGNYKTDDGVEVAPSSWPVTPVWTSMWLHDRLENELGYANVDSVYFYAGNQTVNNPAIANVWNDGVGVINYRGWADSNGWHKPYFHKEEIDEDLNNGWKLPVVMSFVCNTGDFGNDYFTSGNDICFGEQLLRVGTATAPQGAVAMVGPSDLDTDTRFNNVLCGRLWDELIEGRISELAPSLHAGKQAVLREFEGLEINGTNIPEFYHHIYGVLGDPSLSIWLGIPDTLYSDIENNTVLNQSHISTVVRDGNGVELQDVVGALMDDENSLIGKGLSNENGTLDIDFEDVLDGATLYLYLNTPQYLQKKISLTYNDDDGTVFDPSDYEFSVKNIEYTQYAVINSLDDSDMAPIYDWVEINGIGTNLELTDDSQVTGIPIGFDFMYYGQTFSELSVCSNGWISFEYSPIDHFWNFSIPFPMGPSGMIAPFFDDLDDNVGTEPFNVYSYQDTENGRFIIQWDDVANGEDDEFCNLEQGCTRETFQLILLDPSIHTTSTGDGEIIFQYKEIHDIDANGNYSTVGIESLDQNHGYQYQFRNMTNGTHPVQDGLAILFTTNSSETFLQNRLVEIPKTMGLLQNYPNPFNPSTNISFELEKPGLVSILVFDLSGSIVDEFKRDIFYTSGLHAVEFDGKDLSSGIYFYQLQVDGVISTRKMALLK